MSKGFLFKLLVALTFLGLAVAWLLSFILKDTLLDKFNLLWVVVIISGVMGLLFLLRGLFEKTAIPIKKFYITVGCGLLVLCAIVTINIFALKSNLILPIVAIGITAAILFGILATGGKSWDTGDNQKVGYKNYHQRKAEEEKKNQDK